MEGSVQLAAPMYATLGEEGHREVPISETAARLSRSAMAVVALGTCSSFGGIPSGSPNPTGATSIAELLAREKIDTPVVNIPGCPPHPDWLVGTLATMMRYGREAVAVDESGRPMMFYGKLVHENCPRRADFDAGKFAKNFGESGCLYELGCKGTLTHADCPLRRWNNGVNWVIGSGAPCNGCVEPEFPDLVSPFYERLPEEALLVPRKES